jgi:ATP-dependent helicase Lhr and Lhr-like helicase
VPVSLLTPPKTAPKSNPPPEPGGLVGVISAIGVKDLVVVETEDGDLTILAEVELHEVMAHPLVHQRDAGQLLGERGVPLLGDRRVVVHSPFGARVHHAWTLVVRARIRDAENLDVEAAAVDDGFMLRFPGRDSPVPIELIADLPEDEELDDLLLRELQISPLFGVLFRECAARALLLPRRGPNQRTPLWLQRIRAQDLMQLVKRYGEFPILLEAYREAWDDLLRVRDFRKVADGLRSGDIAVRRIASDVPTPFAMHFLFDYNMAFQYVGDYPRAEWRSQLLAVDRDLLARVVRPDALRDLLDDRAIERVERLLQRIDDRSRPRGPDELADALDPAAPCDRRTDD